MEDKMARLRRLLRDAGRAEDEVAIAVTAPVVVTKTLAPPRPLLHGTPDEIARRFAAIPGSGHPELQRQFVRRRYRSAERSDGSVYAGGRAARRLTRTGRDLDRPRRAG